MTRIPTDSIFPPPAAQTEPSDGDKGDITVSASGLTWTIDDGVVTFAKLAGAAVITSGETIAANDSDTAVPTAAAVIDYVSWLSDGPDATTSGTKFDFTGFPAGVDEITIFVDGVSLSGTDVILFQAIVSGAAVTTGYLTASGRWNTGGALGAVRTDGWFVLGPTAATSTYGEITLKRHPGENKWSANGGFRTAASDGVHSSGYISLAGAIEGVRITRTGTNTFDAGAVSVRCR